MDITFIDADKLEATWAYLTQFAVKQGLNMLAAIAILLVGWWLSTRARNAVLRLFDGPHVDATLRPMLGSATQWVVRVVTVVLVLSQFGVQTASIIAMLGAAGLAIGLALQGTLQNIAAGIMLVLLRPYRVGQYIDAQGVAGTVRETGLFMTELTTFDGVCLRVPNSKIWGSAITNYSENPTRRLDIEVTVPFGTDVQSALDALRGMLASEKRVLPEPGAEAMAVNFTNEGVTLNVRCWTTNDDYWNVRFAFYERIKDVLQSEGIRIAVPVQEMRIRQPGDHGALTGRREERAVS
ncbi:small-conductance mechanosensitive channel [Cupriavidus gilardii J11]|uniref:Small-conductance mechanosensitive channel n=1 Tax=Cupriavidus gilardii J11 TaxID=936133 RepID=A0A562BQJ5_9BURK|nr:mechanosensitive ion channel domain-containing protein [Cupriavidus gilardii]TWG87477.1 small-conductance mechanosensitive channel [Cupriavidus gilardii J11]